MEHFNACREAVEEFKALGLDISEVNTHIQPADLEKSPEIILETVQKEELGEIRTQQPHAKDTNESQKSLLAMHSAESSYSTHEFTDRANDTQEQNLFKLLKYCQTTQISTEEQNRTLQTLAGRISLHRTRTMLSAKIIFIELSSSQSVKSILLKSQCFKDLLSFFTSHKISTSYCYFLSVVVAGHTGLKEELLKVFYKIGQIESSSKSN